jgi:hypothetical protein
MKKLIIALLLFFGLFGFIGKAANAIEINENCTNGACVATAGGIKIYFSWNMNGSLNQYINNMPYSAITGIDGLPVTVSNYKQIVNSINRSKTQSDKLINEIDNKTGISIPEITGVNVGSVKSTKNENAKDIAKSMSQGLSSSNPISINYNLSFCHFIGKNFTMASGGFNRVLAGALLLMRYYRQNNFKAIDSLLQLYILSIDNNVIKKITIFTPITYTNADLINYKYMKIAKITKNAGNYINTAKIMGLMYHIAKISTNNMQSALYNTLVKGQTIGELAKKHPNTAVAEYLSVKHKKPYPESYAKRFIYYYYRHTDKINSTDYKKYKNYVLIKPAINYNIVLIVASVVLIGGIIGGFVITKRKRQK